MIRSNIPAWPLVAAVVFAAGCSEESRFTTASDEARAAYVEGVEQMGMFYYAEAQRSLDRAVGADSNFAIAWGRKAMLAFRMGQDSAAKASARPAPCGLPRLRACANASTYPSGPITSPSSIPLRPRRPIP